MNTQRNISRLQQLELQLEEAVQMLRLVAQNKRTTVEVSEWLDRVYPDDECVETHIVDTILKHNQKG